jgi:hypothetical protein
MRRKETEYGHIWWLVSNIFFLFISIIFSAVFSLRGLAAVAHGVCRSLSLWVHDGWSCRRGARRLGFNRRGPRRLASPPVGPAAVDLTVVAHGG